MTKIELIDAIVPKNGGAFPTYIATDGYGAFQVRTTIADRNSIPFLNRAGGMIVHVLSDGYYYELSQNLTDWTLASFSSGSLLASDLSILGQVQGSTLYFNGSNWVQLTPGTDGSFLTTHGAGGNPTWTSNLGAAAPINVDRSTALVGLSTLVSRQDHKHDISTASAVSVGTVNAEGTSINIARADHTHAVTGFSISGQTTGDVLYFNGTAWVRLAAGTDGYVLTTHAAGPTWQASQSVVSAYSFVTDWYVDQSAGNDANDGLSSGTALKTLTEWTRRFSPNSVSRTIFQNVNLHIAAGNYTEGLGVNVNSASGFKVNVLCAYTSGSNITLSSVINTVAGTSGLGSGTRGQVVTVSGSMNGGNLLRCTTGSNPGAVAYVSVLNGDAQHVYTSHWHNNTSSVFRGNTVNLTSGDVIVVDTNTVDIPSLFVRTQNAFVIVSNLGSAVTSGLTVNSSGAYFGLTLDKCKFLLQSTAMCSINFMRCAGGWNCNGAQSYFTFSSGNMFYSSLAQFSHCIVEFSGGDLFYGSQLTLLEATTANLNLDLTSSDSTFGMEFENLGSASCFNIGPDCSFTAQTNLPMWGVTQALVGITCAKNSNFYCAQTVQPTMNAVTQILIDGFSFNYSDMPCSLPGSLAAVTNLNTPAIFVPKATVAPGPHVNGFYLYEDPADGYAKIVESTGVVTQLNLGGSGGTTSNNGSVANWYVDAVGGNDSNNGLTIGTALKTTEALSKKLSPNGSLIWFQQPTTIYLAAGSYGDLFLNVTSSPANPLTILGTVTSTSNITLSSVTSTNASAVQRGILATAAGTFVAGARIRVTSGSAIGSVTYSTGLNVDSQHTFVKPFFRASDSSLAFPSALDTVVVDTVAVSIQRVQFNSSVLGSAGPSSTTVTLQDITLGDIFYDSEGVSFTFNQCELSAPGTTSFNYGGFFINCKNLVGTRTFFGSAPYYLFQGHYFAGDARFLGHGNAILYPACCLDNGSLAANPPTVTAQAGNFSIKCLNDVEIENGNASGSAVQIGYGSQFVANGKMWGNSAAYLIGVQLSSGAWAYTALAANLNFPATRAIQISGNILSSFLSIPVIYSTVDAGFVLNNDSLSMPVFGNLGSVTDWYVDFTLGSDTNDGLSSVTAMKTVTGLANKLCPNGATLTVLQNVNVHIAAGAYTGLGNIFKFAGPFTVKFLCAYTSSASITLSSVTNTVAGTTTVGSGTRGQIATSFGVFAPLNQIRCLSGSNPGATAYVHKLNGDNQHAYVSAWTTSTQTVVNLTVGDVVVVDTNTVDISYLNIEVFTNCVFRIEHLGSVTTNGVTLITHSSDLDSMQFYLCRGYFQSTYSSGCNFWSCAGSWYTNRGYWRFFGTLFCSAYTEFDNSDVELSGAESIINTPSFGIYLYSTQFYIGPSYKDDFSYRGNALGVEVEDMTSTAFYLGGAGCNMYVINEWAVWGVTGTTGTGFYFEPNTNAYFNQFTLPTLTAVNQIEIANGLVRNYSQLPLSYSAFDSMIQTNYNFNFTEYYNNALTNTVSLTNPFPVSGSTASLLPQGGYTIYAYICITTPGTLGSLSVWATWTDDSGTSQHQAVTTAVSITTTGSSNGVLFVRLNASSNIYYSVEASAGGFTKGPLIYSLNVVVEKKSNL